MTVSQLEMSALKAAVHDNKVDAVLVAGPQTGTTIEGAVKALTSGKDGPTFIPIDQAEGIGKRTPPYKSIDVPAGAFGGVPPMPPEELKTLTFPLYLVARKDFNSDKMAAFSKALYASRRAFANELPGVISIESPSTDKDASVLVHPGTADYLGDNTKTVFDKYGDWIFYGLLVGPILGSALAGVAGYFRADKNTKRIRQLHRLLQLVRKARTVNRSRSSMPCRTRRTPSSVRPSSRANAGSSTKSACRPLRSRSIRRATLCRNSARCWSCARVRCRNITARDAGAPDAEAAE